jgi:hypothetical protein
MPIRTVVYVHVLDACEMRTPRKMMGHLEEDIAFRLQSNQSFGEAKGLQQRCAAVCGLILSC